MAQIRGNFFPSVRAALERHALLDVVAADLAVSTRRILEAGEATAWYDEGHLVAVYECVMRLRDASAVRDVGRDAVRFAMSSTWRDLMGALEGLLGGTPRMAFEQMPILWTASRRGEGELRCTESTVRHATTELRSFPWTGSAAWNEAWVGHHEALLRHLRFAGRAWIETHDVASGLLRVRTTWVEAAANDTGGRSSG